MERLAALGVSYWETCQVLGAADLFPEELALVHRACTKRLSHFAAGRHCARRALERLGVAPKPLLDAAIGGPAWPEGVVGSLTHTDGFAAAAVSPDHRLAGLGLDAERVEPTRLQPGTIPLIFTPAEQQRFDLGAERTVPELAFLGFSAKEALYKCLHPTARTFFSFTDAELLSVDAAQGTFVLRLLRDLPAGHTKGRGYTGLYERRPGLVITAVVLLP